LAVVAVTAHLQLIALDHGVVSAGGLKSSLPFGAFDPDLAALDLHFDFGRDGHRHSTNSRHKQRERVYQT
jgi:hypothetical protein